MAMHRAWSVGGVTAVLLLTGACDAEDTTDEAVTQREVQLNGMRLNGMRLNGMRLNGMRLNGMRLNGDAGTSDYIEMMNVDLQGIKGGLSWMSGSQLYVQGKNSVVSGTGLVKAIIDYELQEGGKGKHNKGVRIDGFSMLAPGSDVALYQLELKDGAWQSLCEDGARVIMLNDVWDPSTGDRIEGLPKDTVTFACRGAALAKCVEFGYRPWATVGGVSLRDHHQACTRMVRADYCGDGTAHTSEGTPIHVLDELAIQTEDVDVDYVVEAEWGPDGATCLNLGNTRHPDPLLACDLPACGAAFASGGLIQSGKVLAAP